MNYRSDARTRRRGNFKHSSLSRDRVNKNKFQVIVDNAIPDHYPYSTRYLKNEGHDPVTGKRFRNYEMINFKDKCQTI